MKKPTLYFGFLCEPDMPDIRVGKAGKNLKGVVNQVKKGGRKGYVKEYNSGKIVWDNIL